MRTGLVAIGGVVAVLGAGLILALFFLSTGPASTIHVSLGNPALGGGSNFSVVVTGPGSSSGSISISWTTSAPANVTLSPANPCGTGTCPVGPPVLSWTRSTSGNGVVSSPNASVYLLVVTNPGGAPIKFSAMVTVSSTTGITVPTWASVVIIAGGVVLLGIGGVALFLGMFLPGGVYRDPGQRRPPQRHPSLPPEEYDTSPSEGPRP